MSYLKKRIRIRNDRESNPGPLINRWRLQDAFPSRPKAMHFINMPSLMEAVFSIMKGFTNNKMKERLQVGDPRP